MESQSSQSCWSTFGIIFVLVLTLRQLCASINTCKKNNINDILPIKQGEVLENFGYHDEVMTSLVTCAKRCLRQRKCKSFDFDPTNGWCQLNTESFMSTPAGNMANHPTASHYLAEQWPQELLYECRWHDCPADAVCMTDHSQPQRYNCTFDECIPVNSCVDCYTPVRTTSSGRQYSPIGCYATVASNVLPFYLASFRNLFTSGADWLNTTVYSMILGSCANIAGSYELFGEEYYGECWAGNYSDATFPSNEVGLGSCDADCFFGLGSTNRMVVYKWL